jgi:hypothetical protein
LSVQIRDVLHRRTDLSTFVVHLTKDTDDGRTAKQNLQSILSARTIEARTAMGWLGGVERGDAVPEVEREGMKVVCFSETPLEHAYSLMADIVDRDVKLSSYGIGFTKVAARLNGANPVWYVDMSVGRTWELATALDELRGRAVASGFASHPASKILPFIEAMYTGTPRKEFWWEREWRSLGNFTFQRYHVALLLVPEADFGDFESLRYALVDPSWSLERMIAHLADVDPDLTSTFDVR